MADPRNQRFRLTRSSWIVSAFFLGWMTAVLFCAHFLFHYEKTPGNVENAPVQWPGGVPEMGAAERPTVVVVLHPRCSCSRASLNELVRAAQKFQTPFNAVLLINQPPRGGIDWQTSSLYQDAQQELHAQVVPDVGGIVASRFGAHTSGEVILYSRQDRNGRRTLLYAGGVTGARGMVGGNAGVDAMVQAFNLNSKQAGRPVFGCGLLSFTTRPS